MALSTIRYITFGKKKGVRRQKWYHPFTCYKNETIRFQISDNK